MFNLLSSCIFRAWSICPNSKSFRDERLNWLRLGNEDLTMFEERGTQRTRACSYVSIPVWVCVYTCIAIRVWSMTHWHACHWSVGCAMLTLFTYPCIDNAKTNGDRKGVEHGSRLVEGRDHGADVAYERTPSGTANNCLVWTSGHFNHGNI